MLDSARFPPPPIFPYSPSQVWPKTRQGRSRQAKPRPSGKVIPDNFCAKLLPRDTTQWPERRTIRTANIIAKEANYAA
jgi:hypothetical protein